MTATTGGKNIDWNHDKDCEFKTDPERGICYCEERSKEDGA
jgi:hypothetical protein